MQNDVLVSVVVISYNAEKYITETLESIKAQTYRDIELIISDDASKDNTVQCVKEWKEKNADRFADVIIRASETNTGTVHNANLGFQLCKGKYIKLIAADDKLVPQCIEIMVNECERNGYELLTGRMQSFCYGDDLQELPFNESFFACDAKAQYEHLLDINEVNAPTGFYNRQFLESMDFFDERYPLMEDYPFWLKITNLGIKIPCCKEVVVHYRRSEDSVTSTTNERVVGVGYFKTYKKFFYEKKFCEMIKYRKLRAIFREMKEFIYKDIVILFGNKRSSKMTKTLYRVFYRS